MKQDYYTKKDLNLLERYENSNHKYLYPHLKVGLNQKRTLKNERIKLHAFNNDLVSLTKVEKQLTKQIKEIDSILLNKHHSFRYQNGYLFREGISSQLLKNLAKMISNKTESIEYGFCIWRLNEKEGLIRLVSGKVFPSISNFSSNITDRSIQKLQYYSLKKKDQSLKYQKQPWKFSPQTEEKRYKTQVGQEQGFSYRKSQMKNSKITAKRSVYRKLTDIANYNSSSLGIPKSLISSMSVQKTEHTNRKYQLSFRSKNYEQDLFQSEELLPPSKQQLSKMLLRENKIISIWSPPSNYPQLLFVASIQIKQKQVGIVSVFIGKYFCSRYGLNQELFNSLIDWLSFQYSPITQIYLTSTKKNFDYVFLGLGWRMVSWINDQKVKIIYRKKG